MSGTGSKREREDSDEREENPVPNALQKFREALDLTFPLKRLRDFYEESKIKEFAKKQREKIYTEFMFRVVKFTGDRFTDLFKELEKEIQNALEEFLKKNTQFKEASQTILEQMCVEEYKKAVEFQLVVDPQMSLRKLNDLMTAEKTEAVKSIRNQWKGEFSLRQEREFVLKLNHTEAAFLEYQRKLLESAGPTSPDITHFQEESKFKKFEWSFSTKLNELTGPFSQTFSNEKGTISKYRCYDVMEPLKSSLQKESSISKSEYVQTLAKLMEIVAMAETVMNNEYPKSATAGHNGLIPKKDVAAWAWAIKMDAMEHLSLSPAEKGNQNFTGSDWMLQLMSSVKAEYEEAKGDWNAEGLIIREQITYEMDGIKLEAKRKVGPGDSGTTFQSELLLTRLRRVWEARRIRNEARVTRDRVCRNYIPTP